MHLSHSAIACSSFIMQIVVLMKPTTARSRPIGSPKLIAQNTLFEPPPAPPHTASASALPHTVSASNSASVLHHRASASALLHTVSASMSSTSHSISTKSASALNHTVSASALPHTASAYASHSVSTTSASALPHTVSASALSCTASASVHIHTQHQYQRCKELPAQKLVHRLLSGLCSLLSFEPALLT